MLAGNVTALLSPLVFISIFTLIFGLDKYDWKSMAQIRQADDHDVIQASGIDEEAHQERQRLAHNDEEEQRKLARAFKIAGCCTIVL